MVQIGRDCGKFSSFYQTQHRGMFAPGLKFVGFDLLNNPRMSSETRGHLLRILCRLSLDSSAVADGSISIALESAFENLVSSIPASSLEKEVRKIVVAIKDLTEFFASCSPASIQSTTKYRMPDFASNFSKLFLRLLPA